jgi:AraC family transcriptional regulator
MEAIHPALPDITDQIHAQNVERAKQFMRNNFIRKTSIKEISRHACMSKFHFSRIFKKHALCTPHQYLQKIRLEHAEYLLKNTSLSITSICRLTGFSSLEHFSAMFTKINKITPSAYRTLSKEIAA